MVNSDEDLIEALKAINETLKVKRKIIYKTGNGKWTMGEMVKLAGLWKQKDKSGQIF